MSSGQWHGGCDVRITHLAGEVFRADEEPSMVHVLWGELFKPGERVFLRQHLKDEMVNFCLRQTFQVRLRSLWQLNAGLVNKNLARRMEARKEGTTILLMHALRGKLTTSWTWSKFGKALHHKNFNLLFVDLPGFGSSMVNQQPHAHPSEWEHSDWHILVQVMDAIRVPKACTICVGEACSGVMRLIQRSPHQLAKEHFFHNPIVKREIFAVDKNRIVEGSSLEEAQLIRHEEMLLDSLRLSGIRIWATFDEEGLKESNYTYKLMLRCSRHQAFRDGHPTSFPIVTVTKISSVDLVEVKLGKDVPIYVLFPSRVFKQAVINFFVGDGDPRLFRPGRPDHGLGPNAEMRRRISADEPLSAPMQGKTRECSLLKTKNIDRELELLDDVDKFHMGLRGRVQAAELFLLDQQVERHPVVLYPEEQTGPATAQRRRSIASMHHTASEPNMRRASCASMESALAGSPAGGHRCSILDSCIDRALNIRSSALQDSTELHAAEQRRILEKAEKEASSTLDGDLLEEETMNFETAIEASKKSRDKQIVGARHKKEMQKSFMAEIARANVSTGIVRFMHASAIHNKAEGLPPL